MIRPALLLTLVSLPGCALDYGSFDVQAGAGAAGAGSSGGAGAGASGGGGGQGVAGGGQGANGAAASGGATGGQGAAPSGGSTQGGSGGGVGGGGPVCSDDIIDAGEECDDGNLTDDDGCTGCVVDCGEAGAFKDPTSHHCYIPLTSSSSWFAHRTTCQGLGPGTDLASLSTIAEINMVVGGLGDDTWIGGTDAQTENTFVWVNGEPWTYVNNQAPWAFDQPNNFNGEDCVMLDVSATELRDIDCDSSRRGVCERVPSGS